jgi:hypothetical protein
MKLKHLFIVHSVVALIFGAGFVLAPQALASVYGVTLADPDAIYVARLFGAALLAYCFVAFLARDAQDSVARRAIVLGFCLSGAVGFIVTLVGQLTGVMNAFGWSAVLIYLVILTVGYGYFYIKNQDTD